MMTPPTPDEVTAYALSIGFTLDGNLFCDHYEARGWKYNGGVKMVSWKAAVRTWKHHGLSKQASPSKQVNNKCCTKCGGNVGEDGKVRMVMLWKENLPWCTMSCYNRWVREGRKVK
jgi:hypothetical protein